MSNNIIIQLPDGNTAIKTVETGNSISVSQANSLYATVSSSVSQGRGDKYHAEAFTISAWGDIGGGEWSINVTHGLSKKPSVTVIDSFDRVLILDVDYVDDNTVTLTTRAKFSGKAYFN